MGGQPAKEGHQGAEQKWGTEIVRIDGLASDCLLFHLNLIFFATRPPTFKAYVQHNSH